MHKIRKIESEKEKQLLRDRDSFAIEHRKLSQEITEVLEKSKEQHDRATLIVDETFGSIKGLDQLTLTRLAQDEQFSGY